MTGEKTSLESQILGDYKEIEDDVWMTASERSGGTVAGRDFISEEKMRVLEAIQNRKFNRDDIDEFKREEILGENNRGYLTFLGNERTEQDSKFENIVKEIMAEENRDRKIIMERVISVDPNMTMADMPEVEKLFADQNRQQAQSGIWIQKDDGEWVKK
jgi:uncharacterized protein YdbL (DUF1318 family)